MIHLALTHQQADLLHLSLTHLQQLSPEHAPDALFLLQILQQAQRQVNQHQCPICLTSFTTVTVGRTAFYCSPACKQKAYRQRANDRKRQFGSSRNT